MGLSIRGLTQGIMGGVTAYRRGAMQGTEDARALATAEQARQRQAEQDKQTAMYRQLEADLNLRQQKSRESQFEALAPVRASTIEKNLRAPALKTRLVSTAGGQSIVKDVPGQSFGPRPVSRGGSGSLSEEDRAYTAIQTEANRTLEQGRRRVAGITRPITPQQRKAAIDAVIDDRQRRGILSPEQARQFKGRSVTGVPATAAPDNDEAALARMAAAVDALTPKPPR